MAAKGGGRRGKVAGSPGEVPGARSEVGTPARYLQESGRIRLAQLCDAVRQRCRDQASRRSPAPAAAAARRAGRPASAGLSVGPAQLERGSRELRAGRGGARRSAAAPLVAAPPAPRFGPAAGRPWPRARAAEDCQAPTARQADRLMDPDTALQAARPRPCPSAESPQSGRRCPVGSRSASRTSHLRSLLGRKR